MHLVASFRMLSMLFSVLLYSVYSSYLYVTAPNFDLNRLNFFENIVDLILVTAGYLLIFAGLFGSLYGQSTCSAAV